MPSQELKFISLKQAAIYCSYSADYLKLRARSGKLKAQKIGRAWVTTKEWVEDYAREMEAYKKKNWTSLAKKNADKLPAKDKKRIIKTAKAIKPNLKFRISPSFVKNISVIFIIFLVITGALFFRNSLFSVYKNLSSQALTRIPLVQKDMADALKTSAEIFTSQLQKRNQSISFFIKEKAKRISLSFHSFMVNIEKTCFLAEKSAKNISINLCINKFAASIKNLSSVTTEEAAYLTASVFKEYAHWFAQSTEPITGSLNQVKSSIFFKIKDFINFPF